MCVCGGGGGRWGGGKGQGEEWSYHHNGQSNGPSLDLEMTKVVEEK